MGGRGYGRGGGRGSGGRNQQHGGGGRGSASASNTAFNPFATSAQSTQQQNSTHRQVYNGGRSQHSQTNTGGRFQDRQQAPFQGGGTGKGFQQQGGIGVQQQGRGIGGDFQQQGRGTGRGFQQQGRGIGGGFQQQGGGTGRGFPHNKQHTSTPPNASSIFGFSNNSLDSVLGGAQSRQQQQSHQYNQPFSHNQPFQKQSQFPKNSNTNEIDMDTGASTGPFNNSTAPMNIFGQSNNTAFGGNRMNGGSQAMSTPTFPTTQQPQTQIGEMKMFGTPFGSSNNTTGFAKPAAPATQGLFGQPQQQGSVSLADFKQKQQQKFAQLSQPSPPLAASQPSLTQAPSSQNTGSLTSAPSSIPTPSRFSEDMKPVYSEEHFLEFGVPTLPPNTVAVQ